MWKKSETDPGYLVKTVELGNCTVEILRPIMTEAERRQREKQVVTALEQYGRHIASRSR